jgi:predicted RNA-binding Zn-ribbon protein involved in translation (DUF1610 family)
MLAASNARHDQAAESQEMQMPQCPDCGSERVQRSRSRVWSERVRKWFTSGRPHRCVACGWRGWLAVTEPERHEKRFAVECEPLNLDALDARLAAVQRQHNTSEKAGG